MDKTNSEQTKKKNKLDNLKPFKPGQSGNPKGRPPGSKSSRTIAKEILAALSESNEPLDPVLRAVIAVMNDEEARDADRLKAADMIMDRMEGKAQQKVDNTSSDGSMSGTPTKIELISGEGSDTPTPETD